VVAPTENETINAIATTYAGVRFRSRLEARWAAIFELVELRCEYEPLDLGGEGGTGYVPDFVLLPEGGTLRQVLVECKPVMWTHPRANHGEWPDDAPEAREHLARARAAGWRGEFALMGATLGPVVSGLSCLGVGFAALAPDAAVDSEHERPEPVCLCSADANPSVAGSIGSFVLECPGGWGTWPSDRAPRPTHGRDWIRAVWLMAGNAVQWRAR